MLTALKNPVIKWSLPIGFFVLLSVVKLQSYARQIEAKKSAIPPDYSDENSWIALPNRGDIGDTIPPGCITPENQANAQADVFYVHPTVYVNGSGWNGTIDGKRLNGRCDATVKHHATAFNSCAKVYAPRYRQAHLRSFTREGSDSEKALDTAYSDVKKAFAYYLNHYNNGRPIILAGHSQGAYHAARLIEDFFDGKPLQNQLVVAYLVGFNILENRFRNIPVGDSASQTGCFVSWNTVLNGQDTTGPYVRLRGSACINPLTWTRDTTVADSKLHQGAVPFNYNATLPNIIDAQIHGFLLWVTFKDKRLKKGFYHLGTNYHVSDINLFYMNIRENAELRVKSYLSKR